ncbi:COP23 domain-containing protein [Limnoraphis robusta Tam1]|uniref:COP23 domain-containing protein n=1 Tax=Limnoraphis robusta TaxID=1118279 RepID=UPI002B1F94E4|nr:COP23 domain-containing protein [Limnoraphis robusta]MEA5543136.1 COP23 domain-containing protein [Limnoraphis robusta Tam1]
MTMNHKSFVPMMFVAAIATTVMLCQQSMAQSRSRTFFCGTYKGNPATFVKDPSQGDVPLIVWTSPAFEKSGHTPQSRCLEISDRFERLMGNGGSRRNLKAGRLHGHPIICAVGNPKTENCSRENLLITLEPHLDANHVVIQLENLRQYAANNQPVDLNDLPTGIWGHDQEGNLYIDLDQLLQNQEK